MQIASLHESEVERETIEIAQKIGHLLCTRPTQFKSPEPQMILQAPPEMIFFLFFLYLYLSTVIKYMIVIGIQS